MQHATPRGVEDEVECRRESEERDEMQRLVGLRRDVLLSGVRGAGQGGVGEETEGGGEEEEDYEGDWFRRC